MFREDGIYDNKKIKESFDKVWNNSRVEEIFYKNFNIIVWGYGIEKVMKDLYIYSGDVFLLLYNRKFWSY